MCLTSSFSNGLPSVPQPRTHRTDLCSECSAPVQDSVKPLHPNVAPDLCIADGAAAQRGGLKSVQKYKKRGRRCAGLPTSNDQDEYCYNG